MLIRPSSLPRIVACPASIAEAEKSNVIKPSQDARLGSAAHAAARLVINGDLQAPPTLDDIAREHALDDDDRAQVEILAWAVIRVWSELRPAVLPIAAEARSRIETSPGSGIVIEGTADVIGQSVDDRQLIVIDWKSSGDLADCRAQLMGYAAMYPDVGESVKLIQVNMRTRVRDQLTVFHDDIRAFVAEVERIAKAHRAGEALPLQPGRHCRFCPHRRGCPALVGAVSEFLIPREQALAGPDRLAAAHQMIPVIEDAIESVKFALRDLIGDGELTAAGRVYYLQHDRKRKALPGAILKILGPEAILAFIEQGEAVTFSMDKLAKAVAARDGRKVAVVTRELWAALEAADGIAFTESATIRSRPAEAERKALDIEP